jgi:hypothetical protein
MDIQTQIGQVVQLTGRALRWLFHPGINSGFLVQQEIDFHGTQLNRGRVYGS